MECVPVCVIVCVCGRLHVRVRVRVHVHVRVRVRVSMRVRVHMCLPDKNVLARARSCACPLLFPQPTFLSLPPTLSRSHCDVWRAGRAGTAKRGRGTCVSAQLVISCCCGSSKSSASTATTSDTEDQG